jgi:DNA primase
LSGKIDTAALLARIDLAEVVSRYVKLKKDGREYKGLCPFHDERSASFYVIPHKGFVHCFGCGAHHDAIGFVMKQTGCDFVEACRQLGRDVEFREAREAPKRRIEEEVPQVKWVPIMPVPDDAPEVMADNGWTMPVWNPKRGKTTRLKLTRLDEYLAADGRLLGYVARADITDRETGKVGKWTPTITWCVAPNGDKQWCLQAFPDPRPLLGLDHLAAKPSAPVLIVEGEKCRAAGAGAWPAYAVVGWPGGSNGLRKVDWTPLAQRDVVLWPDADEPGQKAMLGWRNDAGMYTPGVAQYVKRVGARSIRLIDTAGQPKGWDIADALDPDRDGWTPTQLAAWAAARVVDLNVVRS